MLQGDCGAGESGSNANHLAPFPQNGAIANVSFEALTSPSTGDFPVRCMLAHGRFSSGAAQYECSWSSAGGAASPARFRRSVLDVEAAVAYVERVRRDRLGSPVAILGHNGGGGHFD